MGDQIVIKVLLIMGLLALMGVLFIQRPGARPLAIRRLTYYAMLVGAVGAVLFPGYLSQLAALVGVGRGTDLLLYGLVLVFISHTIASKSRHAVSDQRFTALARRFAIAEAEPAAAAGLRLAAQPADPSQDQLNSPTQQVIDDIWG